MSIDKTLNKRETPEMFDNIAGTYDRLNHLLSFGLDKRWRRVFVSNIAFREYETITDIASGTGDLLLELQKLNANKYHSVDPASKMLEIAKTKVENAEFIISTAEDLPIKDNSTDLITVSFGIRNFSSLEKSFTEFYRILKPEGIVSIMEFSQPNFFLFRWGFKLHLKIFLPLLGRIISKDKTAYKYLRASILDFSKKTDVHKELTDCGFKKMKTKSLLLGSVKIYTVKKQKQLYESSSI